MICEGWASVVLQATELLQFEPELWNLKRNWSMSPSANATAEVAQLQVKTVLRFVF